MIALFFLAFLWFIFGNVITNIYSAMTSSESFSAYMAKDPIDFAYALWNRFVLIGAIMVAVWVYVQSQKRPAIYG